MRYPARDDGNIPRPHLVRDSVEIEPDVSLNDRGHLLLRMGMLWHTTLTYVAMTTDDLVTEHRDHSPVDAMLRQRR
jgi:hypothetical protein